MSQVNYLLVDINSFFASCEQQDNPHLRKRPVAIVPMLAENTSVLAASIEAKRKGIKTGTKVYEARKMCPGIVFIEGHHKKYTEYHHKIVAAVDEVCPVYKVLSIDEMACELIGRETIEENAIKIALRIKKNIEEKVGVCLTSSVGLSTNILLAKMASDLIKPDGLVSVPKEKIGITFDHLPVEIISGVGRNMKKKLNAKGFYTVGQLRALSPVQMRSLWGSIVGLRLAEELAGQNIKRVEQQSKSMSHEHVLPPNLRHAKGAKDILLKLSAKAAYRLREKNQKCRHLYIGVRDQLTHEKYEKTISFQETSDTFFILSQVEKLYAAMRVTKPIKVSIAVSGLTNSQEEQLSLFADQKTQKISHAMDIINKKFGANTLVTAGYLDVIDQAKVRVAFNHIPTLEDEFD
ncbi:MAG: DNA polymerase [Pseudobdellovibrio sp.]